MNSENPRIEALLTKGETEIGQWPDYISEYQFSDADVDELIALATNIQLNYAPPERLEAWAPLHAWRVLGQLKSTKAVAPIIQCFDALCDDDAALDELHQFFGLVGEPAIEPLVNHLQQPVADEFSHLLAVAALAEIARQHAGLKPRVYDIFNSYMQSPWQDSDGLNGLLICELLDLQAVELIDGIRHLFAVDCVDLSCCGDLEEVEIQLGLRDKRETPAPDLFGFRAATRRAQQRSLSDDFSWMGSSDTYVREMPKIGRNDPCPCESGKKYKKCCGRN